VLHKISKYLKQLAGILFVSILAISFLSLIVPAGYGLPSIPIQLTKIIGKSENFIVDTEQLGDGSIALKTTGLVEISQLFGNPADGVTWFYLGQPDDASGIGSAGDTIRVKIKAAPSPLNLVYPAVDVTTTVTAGHVADPNPERAVALQICTDLDGDANFTAAWKCTVMKDYSGIFINSKLFNEWGERKGCVPITDCFNVTTTGTTTVSVAFNEIERRGLGTELQRSPNDPRLGTLNVAGSFIQQPGGTGDLLFEELKNAGSSSMIVDGSVTPVTFRINCHPTDDKYINIWRMYISCSGIKLKKWACANSALSNGVLAMLRSEGEDLTLLPLRTTNDIKNKFSIGEAGPSGQFRVDIQKGGDALVGALSFPAAAIIKKCGTNGTGIDDYMAITIRDNLTGARGGNMSEFASLVFGFRRTP